MKRHHKRRHKKAVKVARIPFKMAGRIIRIPFTKKTRLP